MPYIDYTSQGGTVPNGGHFRANLKTGATTGLTAGQPIASLRWTDTAHLFVLLGIKAWANINTAFTAAQLVDLEAFAVRQYTAVDSGGTAVLPITGSSTVWPQLPRMRDVGGNAMGPTLLNDLRIATTGTLTAGTRLLDGTGFAIAQFGSSNALGNAAEVEMYKVNPGNDQALVLGANEGIVFQVPTAQGAVGKVVYYINLWWAEVVAY